MATMNKQEAEDIIMTIARLYVPKKQLIFAVKYDGTQELAEAIERACDYSWCEYDEAGHFSGLYAFTKWGMDNSQSQYVEEGDYLIKLPNWYILVPEEEFNEKYEL